MLTDSRAETLGRGRLGPLQITLTSGVGGGVTTLGPGPVPTGMVPRGAISRSEVCGHAIQGSVKWSATVGLPAFQIDAKSPRQPVVMVSDQTARTGHEN
jgi:hypothetical protein